MLKVLVAEDEPLVRKELVLLTRWKELGCTCVGEAADGGEAIQKYKELEPDLVITDIRMPKIDGLKMIETICSIENTAKRKIKTQFIILSGYDDFGYARTAMRQGVREYVLKPADDAELAAAVLRVKAYITAAYEYTGPGQPAANPFTFCEYDPQGKTGAQARMVYKAAELIRSHYVGGITIEEAAETLRISAGHLSRIFRQETGYTFVDYLMHYRIGKAIELLKEPDIRIYEAADMVGYGDSRYFSQIFKRITGLSPKEFRDSQPLGITGGITS